MTPRAPLPQVVLDGLRRKAKESAMLSPSGVCVLTNHRTGQRRTVLSMGVVKADEPWRSIESMELDARIRLSITAMKREEQR